MAWFMGEATLEDKALTLDVFHTRHKWGSWETISWVIQMDKVRLLLLLGEYIITSTTSSLQCSKWMSTHCSIPLLGEAVAARLHVRGAHANVRWITMTQIRGVQTITVALIIPQCGAKVPLVLRYVLLFDNKIFYQFNKLKHIITSMHIFYLWWNMITISI